MSEKRMTQRGTPCSPVWDDTWIERVEESETRLNRRICGARGLDDTPCTLTPNHENGRCRYHGGFNCTGAQPGNRNAVVHGLYARGLQRCGFHCPLWNHCPVPRLQPPATQEPSDGSALSDLSDPFGRPASPKPKLHTITSRTGQSSTFIAATPDIESLLPYRQPVCPYEATHYQLAVTDLLEGAPDAGQGIGLYRQFAQQTALLQVMVNRAAAALALSPLVQADEMTSDKARSYRTQPAAALVVYQRLSSELRRNLDMIVKLKPGASIESTASDAARRRVDSGITPERQAALHHTCDYGEQMAREQAAEALKSSRNDWLRDAMRHYETAFAYFPPLRGECENDPEHRNALITLYPERYPGEKPARKRRKKKPRPGASARTLTDLVLDNLRRP